MATYSINQNGVIEIQILGTLHEQRTRNVFHYRYTGTTQLDGPTTIDALMDEFDTEVGAGLRSLQSADYVVNGVQAQLISPTRYRSRFKAISLPGGVQGASLPSSSCVVLRRRAIQSGKQFQGRIFVPGIPLSSTSESKLLPAQIAVWDLAATSLKEPLEGGTAVEAFVPTISKVGPATANYDVDSVFLDNVLRVQRRRELGVGE